MQQLTYKNQGVMMPNPDTWQNRLIEEQRALEEKLDKLSLFRESAKWDELGDTDRALLTLQIATMLQYNFILETRIRRL